MSGRRRRPGPRTRCLVWVAALAAASAHAQWKVDRGAGDTEDAVGPMASVSAPAGHQLLVFRDAQGRVHGRFELPEGLVGLGPDGCPTLRVDDEPPEAAAYGDAPCEVDGRVARFGLGAVESQRVRSRTLLGIMNGSRLRVLYRLEGLGYAEVEFSLSGSKQSINEMLGGGVRVEG